MPGTVETTTHPAHIEIRLHPPAACAAPPRIPDSPELTLLHTAAESVLRSQSVVRNADLPLNATLRSIRLPVAADRNMHLSVAAASVTISEDDPSASFSAWQLSPRLHVYIPRSTPPQECQFAHVTHLPSPEYEAVWETLHYATALKSLLLSYMTARWNLSRLGMHSSGLIVLHGPPGSGKTAICGALAHKASIRLQPGVLLRVRVDSLLSKWFAESARNVSDMFDTVAAMSGLVVLVLDEVESLSLARASALGSESGDAVRVVNALLRGVDALRARGNVFVVCTSNLLRGVDDAFLDRADLVEHVGEMALVARTRVLEELLEELREKGVVAGEGRLNEVAEACEGLSGRRICSLPVVALSVAEGGSVPVAFERFVAGMIKAAHMARGKGGVCAGSTPGRSTKLIGDGGREGQAS